MDTKKYATEIKITLELINQPEYEVRLDNTPIDLVHSAELAPGPHTLEIELVNKLPNDPTTACVIKEIQFSGIASSKFIWAGVYFPQYPEPWATEQRNAGKQLADKLTNTNYLGWNGVWRLEFTAPIFTWIHNIENLGWQYD